MWRELVLGVLVPAAASAVVLMAWRLAKGAKSRFLRHGWVGAIALGIAFSIAFQLLFGWPGIPPAERWQWVQYLAITTTVIAVIPTAFGERRGAAIAVAALMAGAVFWMLRPPPTFDPAWTWRLGTAAAAVGLWAALEPLSARRPGPIIPLIFLATLAAASVLILQSGFAKLAQLAGALAAATGPMMLIAIWDRRFTLARGAVTVLAPLLVMMLMIAWLYMKAGNTGTVPAASFFLVAIAPVSAWIGELARLRQRAWAGAFIQLAVPCAVLISALIMAKPQAGA